MEEDQVCRTCLQAFKINEVVSLTVVEGDSITLRQKLEACAPELTVGIVHDPVVCKICCAAIVLSYQFRSSCLENEKTLYRFIKQRTDNPYDLITTADLLNISKKDINDEHSYSFLKKVEFKSSFSDNETESLELKFPTTIQASLEGLVQQALADKCFNISTEEVEENMSTPSMKSKKGRKEIKDVVSNGNEVVDIANSVTASASIKNEYKKLVTENKEANIVRRSESPDNKKQCKVLKNNTSKGEESKSEKLDRKENYKVKVVKVINPNTLTYDKTTIASQKKTLKKDQCSGSQPISNTSEKLHASENNSIDVVPFISFKKDCDLNDTIENDLLQINQQIMKNDAMESLNRDNSRNTGKRYSCSKCNKTYNFKSHFDVHIKSHIFKKMYTCPICEKDFAQEKYLQTHKLLHTSSGIYQCDICHKSLSSTTALKRHYRTHTGEKPYKCDSCGKKFSQNIQLNVHMRTHSGYKPFTCNICNFSFSQKSHLMGHLRIHTGEKPYRCDQCPKCFRKNYALQIHKNSHSIKPYQCMLCYLLFKDADVFEKHVKKHLCRSTVTSRTRVGKRSNRILDELEQDVLDINMGMGLIEKIKPKGKQYLYNCSSCYRGFSTRFSLRRHMKIHVKTLQE